MVVLPDDSGPMTSMTRPRGTPPQPSTSSSNVMIPVGTEGMGTLTRLPIRINECFVDQSLSQAAETSSKSFNRAVIERFFCTDTGVTAFADASDVAGFASNSADTLIGGR